MLLRRIGALAAVSVLALGVAAPVLAATTSQTAEAEYIYACKLKTTGLARLVSATTKCKPAETKTWWAKRATQGQTTLNPQGVQGERGEKGEKGDRGIGTQGSAGPRGLTGPVGPAGVKGVDGADGQDGADGNDAHTGVRLMKIENKWYTCKPVAPYKGYPAEECTKGLPEGPAPTPTPTPTATATGGGYTPDGPPTPKVTPTS